VVVGTLEGSTTPSLTPIVKPTKREAGLIDVKGRAFPSISPNTNPPQAWRRQFPKARQLEVRLWKPKQRGQLCLISMASYTWILALRPCEWDCIHLPFALKSVLPQAVASHFGNRLDFVSELELAARLTTATLILVTGTKIFLTRWGKKLPTTVPALSFCTAVRITGRVPGWSFRNLSHAQVGGVTTVRLSMGFHGGDPWSILPFAVKRRLSHIFKYSERPTAVSWNKPTAHYQVTNLISTRLLDRPVRYQTYMVAGGWGERKLIPEEIHDAFDIPSWLLEFPQGSPPIKLLLSCLEAVQHRVPPQDNIVTEMLPTTMASLPASTYLPLLKRCLPHTWADATLITDKASKADDAEVAFSIWDQQILLVITPCISLLQKTPSEGFSSPPISPVQALNRIRGLVQQKQWKLIFLDFRAFIIERHGPNWASTLCAARAAQRIRAAS
jgi:hypothetical protein